MGNILFANNAGTTLALAASNVDTTITVASGAGALFPIPNGNSIFPITLQDATNPAIFEIAYCTGRSGDILVLIRGRENTTALSFVTGDLVQDRPTRDTLEKLGIPFAVDTGSANGMAIAINPVPPILTGPSGLIGNMILVKKSGAPNDNVVTLNVNGLGPVSVLTTSGRGLIANEWPANEFALVAFNNANFIMMTQPFPAFSPSTMSDGSIGSYGWKLYPDPYNTTGFVLEQWGISTFNGSKITFPFAYPNKFLSLATAVLGNPGYNGDTIQYDSLADPTGFIGYGGHPVGGAGPVTGSWIAKGY